jgi:alpha-glucan, water dikinase
MSVNDEITTRTGLKLKVEKTEINGQIQVFFRTEAARKFLLHWGLRRDGDSSWRVPPQSSWPEATKATPQGALESSFTNQNGENRLEIRLDKTADFSSIDFVLFFPDENRWDNNGGKNYRVELSARRQQEIAPIKALQQEIADQAAVFEGVFELAGFGQLAAAVQRTDERYDATLIANAPSGLVFHWGVAQHTKYEWLVPSNDRLPPDTVVLQGSAAQTPFRSRQDGLFELRLSFPEHDAPLGIPFVLKDAQSGRWIKDRGRNFFLPIAVSSERPVALDNQEVLRIADEMIQPEMTKNSWTLMHRFNLCFDLLDRVRGNSEGLALLFVWLRFSALRQLDWQRNYNTKPRELSHSEDRLTGKLTEFYVSDSSNRSLIRLMLGTLGRGGEGQRIRDEILAIMHRHHIKEVAGHFMEEWHQKLHNNTTPDDIVICEAYLAFLRSDGDLNAFYTVLEAGGVTKARLESFERPIRTHPGFVPYLKDGLIHDFEHFLRILKSVHSGTDFETAINAAGHLLDDNLRGSLWHLYHHQNDPQFPLLDLVHGATDARHQLNARLSQNQGTRDLLYLDLALEQFVRTVVERSLNAQLDGDQLADLTAVLLDNLKLSETDQELAISSTEWERLRQLPRFGREWSLHAKAVLDRIGMKRPLTTKSGKLPEPFPFG